MQDAKIHKLDPTYLDTEHSSTVPQPWFASPDKHPVRPSSPTHTMYNDVDHSIALYGSVALVAVAAASAPKGVSSQHPNPVRTGYKAPGHFTTSYPTGKEKRVRGNMAHHGLDRYKSQGPFAPRGWSAHGVNGSVSLIYFGTCFMISSCWDSLESE